MGTVILALGRLGFRVMKRKLRALLLCSGLLAAGGRCRHLQGPGARAAFGAPAMPALRGGGVTLSYHAAASGRAPLLTLGPDLVRGTVVRRPSERNRSPYVGDVRLADGRIAVAHMPSLDMGGKVRARGLARGCSLPPDRARAPRLAGRRGCVLRAVYCWNALVVWPVCLIYRPLAPACTPGPGGATSRAQCVAGADVLLRVAMDRKGRPVGADAMGKHGTPKCEYILQLLRVDDPENAHLGGCWVGAHPSIGEKVAAALLDCGALDACVGSSIVAVQREVANPAGADMRCDFVATGSCGRRSVIEVKTVVDSDYNPETAPSRKGCVFLGRTVPYERAAIFPWGTARQKGPDGEKVVSARAIKHVRELALLAQGKLQEADGTRLGAVLVFVVVRADALSFRPNAEACPSFARHVREAQAAGVRIVARRVSWSDSGEAFDDGEIPVHL